MKKLPSYLSKQPSSSLEVNLVRAALERLTLIHTMPRDLTCSFYTAILKKVVGKKLHATIPKGNMGYDQYTVPNTVAMEPTFVAFLISTRKHTAMASRAIVSNFFLFPKNSELKTTHNTFQDCRVHFFRQPFSK